MDFADSLRFYLCWAAVRCLSRTKFDVEGKGLRDGKEKNKSVMWRCRVDGAEWRKEIAWRVFVQSALLPWEWRRGVSSSFLKENIKRLNESIDLSVSAKIIHLSFFFSLSFSLLDFIFHPVLSERAGARASRNFAEECGILENIIGKWG